MSTNRTESIRSRYAEITAFRTKDGSEIRELMHPQVHGNRNQSLAEAVVEVGQWTQLHCHHQSEELYFITQGRGEMRLGDESFLCQAGDTICILPGTAHAVGNVGQEPLRILCCCSPPYSHDDTELLHDGER